MPKRVKWEISADDVDGVEVEEREEYEPYQGEMPRKNTILLCDLKTVKTAEFASGNMGLKVLAVVNDPGKPQFNGLAYWENLVDVDSMAWKIRQFLDAIGATGKDWAKTLIDEDDRVVSFGKIKVAGLQARIAHKTGEYDNEPKPEVGRWVPKGTKAKAKDGFAEANKGRKASDEEAEEEYDEDEPPF